MKTKMGEVRGERYAPARGEPHGHGANLSLLPSPFFLS